ncbi:MAG TPA: ECF-type sigma factor [Blastocatellia bacterium]|nr:ECF-type sigma factor [Blastocatellia bacterium]HMV82833.1 ECF-type sigma factor [Blastocatellia bacterium]HMX25817.1 ECF-type sigma factor [Blastocatellia bacterium]HMY76103.1 ECF-type sigma factor [Blastocatellia bacterium]HMZ18791.1 ECF-type sigma factor [Blastocatellia bacterium]
MAEPATSSVPEVTGLLLAWGKGDHDALEQLTPMVDVELRRIAEAYLRRERSDHLLQTTALVNEAWMRLIDWQKSTWQSRAHFFGVAASLMRKILVGEARRRRRQKRGGNDFKVSLAEAELVPHGKQPDLIALDDALDALAEFDERKSRIVELRFFGGLSVAETAEVLKSSERTVAREWELAKSWLYRQLSKDSSEP